MQLSWRRFLRSFGLVPCELLYANDLAVIADSEKEVIRKLNFWREGLEKKGLSENLSKTKLMVGGERRNTNKTGEMGICSL